MIEGEVGGGDELELGPDVVKVLGVVGVLVGLVGGQDALAHGPADGSGDLLRRGRHGRGEVGAAQLLAQLVAVQLQSQLEVRWHLKFIVKNSKIRVRDNESAFGV